MKGVLRFLLGRRAVRTRFMASHSQETRSAWSQFEWTTVSQHEDEVRFINQAIEWENVVSFLYSYFWDLPTSWDFIRQVRHPDATRQAFLRAGSARGSADCPQRLGRIMGSFCGRRLRRRNLA